MKFGLSFLPDGNGYDLSAYDYYENVLSLAKIADQTGMSTIKMTEHYLHSYGGFCPDPALFLASLATCTNQIRLLTGCILPTFHHPIEVAAKTAMLDVLSKGRLDVGFARAYLPHEFTAFQISMDGSRERFEQSIDAVVKLWTEENLSIFTDYFSFTNATSFPQPLQDPHPPIWCAAVTSRQSFSWIGEKGFNLLVTPPSNGMDYLQEKINIYLESFSISHRHKTPKIILSLPLLISEEKNKAIQLSDQYLQKYINVWADATETWSQHTSSDYPGYYQLGKMIRCHTPKKMRDNLQALVGNASQIVEFIGKIAEIVTLDEIIWQLDFGAQPGRISHHTLEVFIEKVLPQVMLDKCAKP